MGSANAVHTGYGVYAVDSTNELSERIHLDSFSSFLQDPVGDGDDVWRWFLMAYVQQIWQMSVAPVISKRTSTQNFLIGSTKIYPDIAYQVGRADLQVTILPPSVDIDFGTPDIIYWGKYAWLFGGFDGTEDYLGDLKWCNFAKMTVYPPVSAKGIAVFAKPGVEYSVTVGDQLVTGIANFNADIFGEFDPMRGIGLPF